MITNTYYGIIFAIIFKKPFTVLCWESKRIKITDLLKMLKLDDRILRIQYPIDTVNTTSLTLNYSKTEKTLEKEILNSKAYLKLLRLELKIAS